MSVKTLAARIQYLGGDQLNRIDKQKLRSLQAVLKNSYQTRYIKTDKHAAWPCLINKNSLKSDYDKEYISIEYASGLEAGDTFECLDDSTHWMIYLPIITETAYLRAEIIRCRYTLDINGKIYWVYFQGPTETDLRWFIKNQININELNLSGTIYIKNDENTKQFFHRFTHIKLDGHIWEVQVTDSISVPGILELEVQEYYDNTIAELPEIKLDEETPLNVIKGQTVVKQDSVVGYMIDALAYDPTLTWEIKDNPRVKIEEILENGRICKVRIADGAIRTFRIYYGEQFLEVTIDWQKPIIQGPQEVYPYDVVQYSIAAVPLDGLVNFKINNNNAKIIDQNGGTCTVEIVSSKKGKFDISATYGDIETILPVNIKSF